MCLAHITAIMSLCALACIGLALTHRLERLCDHARETEPSTLWLLLARAPRHGDPGPLRGEAGLFVGESGEDAGHPHGPRPPGAGHRADGAAPPRHRPPPARRWRPHL